MIQEKDFLYRVPVKNVLVTTPRQQVRNPEILVDLEGGEFMHGNILDANSTNKLINQSVKDAVDNKLIESGYVTQDLLDAETTRATEQENSLKTLIGAETSARTKGDEGLSAKIKAEQTRAEGKEKEISDKLAIVDGDSNTEGSFRKAIADVIAAAPEDLDTLKEIADKLADNDDLHTALNQAITDKADASALLNEVTRATGAESALQTAINTKADATALSNYVLTAALNKQIDTLNTAISAKQDAGSYIPYDQTVTSAYKIDKDLVIDNSIGRAMLGTYSISVTSNSNTEIQINPTGISLNNDGDIIRLSGIGITLPNGDSNHVLTSNGSTINMDNYAKNSDLSSQLGPKADRSDLIALERKVTDNTTTLEGKQNQGNYVEYIVKDNTTYTIDKNISISDASHTTKLGAGFFTTTYTNNSGDRISIKYSYEGMKVSNYRECLATSDGTFKPISDFVLKTELPTVPTKTSELTNDSKFIAADYIDGDRSYGIINGITIGLQDNGQIHINGGIITSDVGGGFILDDTGLTFNDRPSSDIPTAGGDFININDYLLKSTYDKEIAALEARIAALEATHA